jgi:hypothetical protein
MRLDSDFVSDNGNKHNSPLIITSDEEKKSVKVQKSRKNHNSSSTSVVKAYWVPNNDIVVATSREPKYCTCTNNSQLAVEAISSIGTFFAPDSINKHNMHSRSMSATCIMRSALFKQRMTTFIMR